MMLKKLQAFPKKKKKNLDTDFTSITKGDSKWIIDLTVNWNTIKFLEGSIGENLFDLRFDNDILDTISKARSMKDIMHKLDFITKPLLCTRHCRENGKTSHRLKKKICKTRIWHRTSIQTIQRTLRIQQ